jgi:signal transduction histidine kinase
MNPGKGRLGLKAKITVLTGCLTGIFLLGASLLFTFQSKRLILEHLERSSTLVTTAFSVYVLDAIIKDENDLESIEDLLGHYLMDFLEKHPQVMAIAVLNRQGEILAGQGMNRLLPSGLSLIPDTLPWEAKAWVQVVPSGAWIATCSQPLMTGERHWGHVIIHFNASSEKSRVTRLFWFMVILTTLITALVLAILLSFLTPLTHSLSALKLEIDHFDPDSEALLSPIQAKDEVGILMSHFNDLKLRLTRSRQELLRAQTQIHQAEKLASIGRFASGMAHEINNPLNGIQSCLYAIRQDPTNTQQTLEYLSLVTEGLHHIEMVVRKLLGFARQSAAEKTQVDLKQCWSTVLGLLEYKLQQARVEVREAGRKKLPLIPGDPALLQEVFMNLAINAFDAIAEKAAHSSASYRGLLTVTWAYDDNSIQVKFHDNGCGVPPQQKEQLFDPFFTTKEPGKGTGLGLSVALGIVESHHGSLVLESEWGQSTTFTLTLPLEDPHAHSIG